jgi:hypothetical protein
MLLEADRMLEETGLRDDEVVHDNYIIIGAWTKW